MIHESKVFEIVQLLGNFSLKFVSKTGELVAVDECSCTSFHSSGRTMNIRLKGSGLVRKVVRKSVVEINGEEVFI
ncbi:MAG: hypothetical protein Q4F69_02495 [Bacteroidia bacterium]|nr:hypothetical protein [Bacteroidia bacterium]